MSPLHDLCQQYCQDRNKGTNFGRDFSFSRQRTILSYIVEHSNEKLLAFVLELGKYTPDSKDKDGRTPLAWAAEKRQEAMVKLLLDKGVKVDSKDKYNQTTLW
jgi:ankyrin repeat protein